MGVFMTPVESDRKAVIAPINLSEDGIFYAESQLKDDGSLSSLVLQLFNSKGSVFAPVEKGITLAEAKQFTHGQNSPTVAIRKWLADYIASQWGNDCQLIVEDPWMKPEDIIRHVKLHYFTSDGKIYYVPEEKDMYHSLTAGGQEASSWQFFIFVIAPSVPLPPDGNEVDQDYMGLLAGNTQAVLLSSYDREGYVVWQKKALCDRIGL